MKSTEKVWLIMENLQDAEDGDLAEAFPQLRRFPPTALRYAITGIAETIPNNPDDLDAVLTQVGEFVLALRSDHEPAQV